jgi:hypothetical protein
LGSEAISPKMANIEMAKNINFQKSKHFLPFDLEICILFETDKIATHFLVKRHSVPMEKINCNLIWVQKLFHLRWQILKWQKIAVFKKVNIFCHLIWKFVSHLKLIKLQPIPLSKDILYQWKKEFLTCSDYCLTSGGITPTKVHMGMPTLKLTNTVSRVSLLYEKKS